MAKSGKPKDSKDLQVTVRNLELVPNFMVTELSLKRGLSERRLLLASDDVAKLGSFDQKRSNENSCLSQGPQSDQDNAIGNAFITAVESDLMEWDGTPTTKIESRFSSEYISKLKEKHGDAYVYFMLCEALDDEKFFFTDEWYASALLFQYFVKYDDFQAGFLWSEWVQKRKNEPTFFSGIRQEEAQRTRAEKGGKASRMKREERKKRLREIVERLRVGAPWSLEGTSGIKAIMNEVKKERGDLFRRDNRLLSEKTITQLWDELRSEERQARLAEKYNKNKG